MSIAILINKLIASSIIRRINIDALHPLSISLLQQVQRLPVFGVDEQSVDGVVQVFKARQQAVGEVGREVAGVGREVAGVENQRRVCFEKLYAPFRSFQVGCK
jgi:hypothetical protein